MTTCFTSNLMCFFNFDLSFKINFFATCLYNLALYDENLFMT
jgi:hypothetical protein